LRTVSIFLMLILADGLQTTVAYSRTGRTNVLNALIKTAVSRVVKHLKIRFENGFRLVLR